MNSVAPTRPATRRTPFAEDAGMPPGVCARRLPRPRWAMRHGAAAALATALLALIQPATSLAEAPPTAASTLDHYTSDSDLVAHMPRLTRVLRDPQVTIHERIALLEDLARRGLVFGPSEWVRLLRTTSGAEQISVLRAVAAHPSAGVTAELARILEQPNIDAAAAAALSLGSVGNQAAIEPLARSLGRNEPRLSAAAIRSLTRVGTLNARRALELATAFHSDFDTRRRAGAAVIALARRHGTTLAPALVAPEVALATAPPSRDSQAGWEERD